MSYGPVQRFSRNLNRKHRTILCVFSNLPSSENAMIIVCHYKHRDSFLKRFNRQQYSYFYLAACVKSLGEIQTCGVCVCTALAAQRKSTAPTLVTVRSVAPVPVLCQSHTDRAGNGTVTFRSVCCCQSISPVTIHCAFISRTPGGRRNSGLLRTTYVGPPTPGSRSTGNSRRLSALLDQGLHGRARTSS